jgi:hypothetical protein
VWAPERTGVVLAEPFMVRDTLYGRSRGDTLALSIDAVERLERPRLDGARTAGAVLAGVAGWLSLGLLAGGWD